MNLYFKKKCKFLLNVSRNLEHTLRFVECERKLQTNMQTGQKDDFTKHHKALAKRWNSLYKLDCRGYEF